MPWLSNLDSRQAEVRTDLGHDALAENLCGTFVGLRQDHNKDRVRQLSGQIHITQALAQFAQPGEVESAVCSICRFARGLDQQHGKPALKLREALYLMIEKLENDRRSIEGRACDKQEFVIVVEQ